MVVTRKASKYSVTPTADIAGVPVETATVTLEQLPLQITAAGTVEAYASAPVNSDVDGQLTELHFTEGQFVKKGQLLFTIDSRFSQDGLGHSRAAQSEAVDEQRLAETDLARDRAEATAAEAEARRYDDLYKDGVVSKEEDDRMRTIADDLEAVVKADQDARTSARQTVSAAGTGLDTSTMQGDKAIREFIGLAQATLAAIDREGQQAPLLLHALVQSGTPLLAILNGLTLVYEEQAKRHTLAQKKQLQENVLKINLLARQARLLAFDGQMDGSRPPGIGLGSRGPAIIHL